MKKTSAKIALLFFGIMTSLMFSQRLNAAEPLHGGKLVIATQQDPITMLGAISVHIHTLMISDTMFNGLMRTNGDSLDPSPDLAEKWEVSPDGMTYTFYLVKNATWHDGKPFTSSDVKFSIEEVWLKHHPAGKILFGAIDRVETPDLHTVILKLKYPYAPMMTWLMIKNASPIVPQHIYEGTDIKKNPYNFKPIGTGPFKFKEYVKGSHVRVVRNENYFRQGQPYLDEIIFRIIPDWTSMLAAFETGEVNYLCWGIPRHSLPRLRNLPHVKVDLKLPVHNTALWTRFNLRHEALGKLEVRRAIAYATDKEEILKKAFYGQGRIAESFINPDNPVSSWAYNPEIPVYEYNPEKANTLLDEAGFPRKSNGIRFSIRQCTSASDLEAGRTNEILRDQWRKVGIDLKVIPLEGTAFAQLVYKKWDFDLAMGFWFFGPDPSLIGLHIDSRQIRPGLVPGNIMGYRNEKVDALLDKAAATLDLKERARMYGEISKILAEDLPVMWFIFDSRAFAYDERFVGLPTPPFGTNGSYDEIWSKTGK